MYNITLINTRHQSLGECNSCVLNQIIEAINPEVIFEEVPPNYIGKKTHLNLEEYAIGMYSVTHRIKRVPVDSDDVPPESFFDSLKSLHNQIEKLEDINGTNYRNFTDKHKESVKLHGFKYLNSIDCINNNDKINNSIEEGLKQINNNELSQIYNSWKIIINKREHEMLQNIYRYSIEHSYNRAIFTLGSGHRKSVIQKIEDYERKEKLKLNWIILNY